MITSVSLKRPPVVLGFILLGLVPAILAWVDVAALQDARFEVGFLGNATIGSQAWIWSALLLQFAFIVDFRSTGQRFYVVSRLDYVLVFLLLVQAYILGQVTSANPAASNLHLMRIILALATGAAAYYAVGLYGNRFLWPTYIAIILGMVLTIPPLLYLLYFVPEARNVEVELSWVLPGYGALRVYGAGLEAALVVGVALLARPGGRRLWLKVVLLGAVLALWAVFLWSGARGGLLSIGVALVVVSAIRPGIALRLWGVALVTGTAGAALSFLIWLPENGSFGFLNMFARSMQDSAEKITSLRVEMWADSLSIIMQSPWFGHGLSQFSNLWPLYGKASQGLNAEDAFQLYLHVHNVVLGALLALGFIGGTAFFVLSIRAVVKAAYRVGHGVGTMRVPALLGLLTLLGHSFFTGIYVFPQTVLLLGLFFGICLAPDPDRNENKTGVIT